MGRYIDEELGSTLRYLREGFLTSERFGDVPVEVASRSFPEIETAVLEIMVSYGTIMKACSLKDALTDRTDEPRPFDITPKAESAEAWADSLDVLRSLPEEVQMRSAVATDLAGSEMLHALSIEAQAAIRTTSLRERFEKLDEIRRAVAPNGDRSLSQIAESGRRTLEATMQDLLLKGLLRSEVVLDFIDGDMAGAVDRSVAEKMSALENDVGGGDHPRLAS